ncbi:class I SAM-dependent methyltransferase [Verrucomicrobiota bacterium]
MMRKVLKRIKNCVMMRPDFPYQDVWFRGSHYPGMIKTRRLFYSLDILKELPGKTFTDLGCNRGGLVFLAEENGCVSTTGVDVNSDMIANAREIAEKENSRSVFIREDMFTYLEKMQPVDIVTCMAVFRHLYVQLKKKYDPSFVLPKTYLTYKSMDVLIRQNVNDPKEVIQ